MSTVLVDSNVLLDVLTGDPAWAEWSEQALAASADSHRLVINAIVYAEISVRFSRIEDLEDALPGAFIEREAIPFEAAFLAAKAFVTYRRRGGARSAPLPDFFIGAHAAVAGYTLLTRDRARYRSYFPRLPLIAPPRRGEP
jgi:predicted nucleic acid-binding protein